MSRKESKDAYIKRLEDTNALLQRRVDNLLDKNDELTIALQAEREAQVQATRRRSWGNTNGARQ